MKRQIIIQIQAAFALLLLMAACGEDSTNTWQDTGKCSPLIIQVCSEDFTSVDGASTRVTDVTFTTVFQDGDQLGIVTEQPDGSKQNLCATYNGATKTWEGIYYNPEVSYVSAYFPYQAGLTEQLSGISGDAGVLSALKALMPPLSDQSSKDAYNASDLLTGTCVLNTATGGKSLDVTLTHAYSLLLLQAGTEYITNDGYAYRTPLGDVQITVDDALCCTPFASVGGYRLIVDKKDVGPSSAVECFYTLAGKTYKVSGNSQLTEGKYYLYRNVTSSMIRDLAIGDFYYSDGSIAPYDTDNPLSEGCIGVVYWLGNAASEEDMLLKQEFPDCTHGLVVALNDASSGALWSSRNEDITNNWLKEQSLIYYIASLRETNKMQGYANTRALEGYNSSDRVTGSPTRKVLPVQAIKEYSDAHTTPASSSGWYCPSVKELKYICWGQDADGGTSGRDMLNRQFDKVQGATPLQSGSYWSSTEYDSDRAWYMDFGSGNVNRYGNKGGISVSVPAVLAF